MAVYPARGANPYYDELKAWLDVARNTDGTLKGPAISTALGYTPMNKAGDTFGGNLTGGANNRIILTADDNGASIQRLLTFQSTTEGDRPWISWLDEAGRHRVGFGYHTRDGAAGAYHEALEVKTSADPLGATPGDMRTRLSIGTDADRTLVGLNYLSELELNAGSYGTEQTVGIITRMPDSGGASRRISQWLTKIDASEHTWSDIDIVPIDVSTKNVTLRFFRSTNTSGARRVSIYKGDGTNTEMFAFNPADGSLVAKVASGVIQLNDGSGTTTNAIWGTNLGLVSAGGEARIVGRSTAPFVFYTGGTINSLGSGTERLRIDSAGSVSIGAAALSTAATGGFLYIPTMAGAPTGTPTAKAGTVPLAYDTTNNRLYLYNGAWRSVAVA